MRAKQLGLSLISLMIALTIGTFLLAGLFDLWLQTRNTFSAQGSLAQLQDNERTALTLMSNIVQSGGYYPLTDNYPTLKSTNPPPSIPFNATNVFVAASGFSAGQFISGTTGGTGANDTLNVRFMSDGSTLDCQGQVQPDRTLVTNSYQIDAQGDLQCAVSTTNSTTGATSSATAETIVFKAISQFTVLYGIDPTNSASSPSEYMTATTVTSDNEWMNVRSVRLELTFTDPVNTKPLPPISRIVAVTQTTNAI